ncbi:hypothetical protein IDJ79_05445 [Candidatus Liberibacter asiaticus]|uniref:hypothetical protein n=1 Tax=Liberibacter asiaticus TaxID=34021 RepID=UPI0004517CDF|nr:hypothetical protein [Candidatus Liberibacter asiaticus]UKY34157.1 hypothetical protein IDJ79_05445 [Candidatus Liberibacter asiaticus]
MEKTAVRQKVQRDSVEIRFTKLETALPYLATKADLADVRTELKQDIANVRTELKADIADVRTELACTKSELKDAINSQTKWFMGIIVSVLVSTIGILLKLSSH